MVVHSNFADWYRSAAVTPPEGLLEKRWTGVQTYVTQMDAAAVLDLAVLFAVPNSTDSYVPGGFIEAFRDADDGFASKHNLQELRVLAGSVLRVSIEEQGQHSDLAALALACGSFATRETSLPEREHVDVARRFLLVRGCELRATEDPPAIRFPSLGKAKLTETLQPVFAQNTIAALQEPLIAIFTEFASSVTNSFEQCQKAIEQLAQSLKVREEELNILWWLHSHFSRDLQKSFSEVGYSAGSVIFPAEVSRLSAFVLGAESITAVLAQALHVAGAPSLGELVTIADAINATPRDWRETQDIALEQNALKLLCPVSLALKKSLDTDGASEWLPVYKKSTDIPVDRPLPLMQLALQSYEERMLLRAVARLPDE